MNINDFIRPIDHYEMDESNETELEKLAYRTSLLFYGELDEYFLQDLIEIIIYIELDDKPKPYLFDTSKVYWYLISILVEHDYVEYGTSPRFPWLTEKGVKLSKELEGVLDDTVV